MVEEREYRTYQLLIAHSTVQSVTLFFAALSKKIASAPEAEFSALKNNVDRDNHVPTSTAQRRHTSS